MGDKQQEIGKVKAKSDDSAWILEESKVLLQLLIEATLRGWCDANGLLTKDIVTIRILPALNERRKCNKTCKHYTSRMIYFKKEYGKYSQFMGSNYGFGWDANTKRFVADDEVWEEYFRAHPDQRSIHKKSCDDLEDLQIVLGDATAIGKHSLGLGEETDARTFVVKDRQGGIEEDEQVGIENLFYDEKIGALYSIKTKHHIKLHHSVNHPHSYPLKPLAQRFPHQSPTIGNEIEPNTKGILDHLRPLIKLELWKIFHLLSIQLPPTSEESIVYWRKWIRIERQNSIGDAIKETPNLDEPARYQAIALLDTKTKKDAFMKMFPEEQSNWICYNLK